MGGPPRFAVDDGFAGMARRLRGLSHPTRLEIACVLRRAEANVTTIADALGLSLVVASKHLGLLRSHHLVSARRQANRTYYRLADDVERLLEAIAQAGVVGVVDLIAREPSAIISTQSY